MGDPRHLFRGPGGHDLSSLLAAFRPEIDDVVRTLDHLEVVLDDDHGVAVVYESLEHVKELLYIREMQPRRRFIQDEESPPFARSDKLLTQLDALSFPTGERGRGLSELHVPEPHIVHDLEHRSDAWNVLEVLERFLHVHVEHVRNVLPFEPDLERLPVEALAIADGTDHPDVREEIHFELVGSVSVAGFASSSLDIEAEPALGVTSDSRFRQAGEEVPNRAEHADVSRRIRARGPPDWALIDVDGLLEFLLPADGPVRTGEGLRSIQVPQQGFLKDIADQRTLA